MHHPFPPILLQKNNHPPLRPSHQFCQVANSHDSNLNEELTDLF